MNHRVGKQSLLARQGDEEHRQVSKVVDVRSVRKSETDVMLRRRTGQVIEIYYRVILFEKIRRSKRNVTNLDVPTEY